MEIDQLIEKAKRINLPRGMFAVFGSAILAVRGLREAPNIDLIVKDSLWTKLLEKYQPDGEGFIRIGQVKISNWWFAPVKKGISEMIDEAEIINELPFVKIEEVLFYKKTLKSEKDENDVKLIEKFITESSEEIPINLGMSTYKNIIKQFVNQVGDTLPEVISMVIFGSVSRGQAKGDSDIDMFVFFEDTLIEREKLNLKLNEIIISLRDNIEYKKLEVEKIYPEIYPFLISKKESRNMLWVFLDATEDGINVFDKNCFVKNLITEFKSSLVNMGSRRVKLPDGGWCWTLFKDYNFAVKGLSF